MSQILFYAGVAACLVTAGVLAVGVGGFGARHRQGFEGARFSNKLMRWRIIAQFTAVVLFVLAVLLLQRGG